MSLCIYDILFLYCWRFPKSRKGFNWLLVQTCFLALIEDSFSGEKLTRPAILKVYSNKLQGFWVDSDASTSEFVNYSIFKEAKECGFFLNLERYKCKICKGPNDKYVSTWYMVKPNFTCDRCQAAMFFASVFLGLIFLVALHFYCTV